MLDDSSNTTRLRVVRRLLLLGTALFLVSFALPAYRLVSFSPSPERGYECAVDAFKVGIGILFKERFSVFVLSSSVLLLMSDLINLLVPTYLVLSFVHGRYKLRAQLTHLTFISIAATWIWFALDHSFPMYGHWAWVAGALLVVGPRWLEERRLTNEAG